MSICIYVYRYICIYVYMYICIYIYASPHVDHASQHILGSMPPLRLWLPFCCRRSHRGQALEPSSDADSEESAQSEEEVLVTSSAPVSSSATEAPFGDLVVQLSSYKCVAKVGLTPEQAGRTSASEIRWYCVWYLPDRHYSLVAGCS